MVKTVEIDSIFFVVSLEGTVDSTTFTLARLLKPTLGTLQLYVPELGTPLAITMEGVEPSIE